MKDKRIERWASLLLDYSLGIEPKQLFLIQGTPLAMPLINEVYRQALKRRAFPYVKLTGEGTTEIFYQEANEEQLKYISPMEKLEVEKIDASLRIIAEWNRKSLTNIDPKRLAWARKARSPIFERFLTRAAKGELRWCLTAYPDYAQAQDAEMSLEEFAEFIFNAGWLNNPDPIKKWRKFSESQKQTIKILQRKETITIKAPGTDLKLSVKGRRWINCDGKENFPDGEIFTAPVEDSIQGEITYSFPAVYAGKEVAGVKLVFKNGEVKEAKAEKGEEYLKAMINMDPGAKRVGEFSFGTNYGIKKFIKNILFDEKIGGTIHLALGSSYPETGGVNKSGLHWDMICDLRKEGEVYADGELIYKNGKFLI
ncbi:MAG: aminopeptidase [candidate division WOR-3 bacterium]